MKPPVPAGTSHPLSPSRVGLFDTFQPQSSAIVYQVELHFPATQPFLSEYLSGCLQVKYPSGEITQGLLTYSIHGMNHEASPEEVGHDIRHEVIIDFVM